MIDAIVCITEGCERRQPIAMAHEPGGITHLEAQALGWEKTEQGWRCMFCTGKTAKLRALFDRER